MKPQYDDDEALGASGLRYKALHAKDATISGTATLSGTTALSGTVTVGGVALSASAAEVNETAGLPTSQSTLVVAAAVGTAQTITGTLKDADGSTLAAVRKVRAYFCTDAAGAVPSTSGAGNSVTATTGAVLKAITAKLDLDIVTAATGIFVLSVDNAGGGGAYTDRLALVLPSGAVVVSAALNTPAA